MKKVSGIILCIVVAFSLAGCGSSKSEIGKYVMSSYKYGDTVVKVDSKAWKKLFGDDVDASKSFYITLKKNNKADFMSYSVLSTGTYKLKDDDLTLMIKGKKYKMDYDADDKTITYEYGYKSVATFNKE